ncbi:isochorismatase [Rhodocaloribacter sp.]
MKPQGLPIPDHFDPGAVGEVRRVAYQERAAEARAWAERHAIPPASEDAFRIALVLIDVQNTFCIPGFELFVGGSTGTAAVDDNRRLCAFLYRNLHRITHITATMDTHRAMQIFHSLFFIDDEGRHPEPFTVITVEDVAGGRWRFNPALAPELGITPEYGQRHLEHYVRRLAERGKYALTVWPYHAMLGGIGHALVPAVEEAVFFHTVARYARPEFLMKGTHPLTEHYSALAPEVNTGPGGERLTEPNDALLRVIEDYDAVVIAGQAKSHCVAWTVEDLLRGMRDGALARKVYLLEDCTSPIVAPGADFTEAARAAFERFTEAGMHVVRSTDPLEAWPGLPRDFSRKTSPAKAEPTGA